MATAAPDRTLRATDLTPRDWLEAGQSLLRRGGLRALKLRPLAAELNVSTGSFYHHFTDFDAYQGRLADYFAGEHLASILDTIMKAERNPVDRIRLLAEIVRRRGLFRLSIAMRAWAESDPRAQAAVERNDAQVLAFLSHCLEANGLTPHQARVRGYALMTLGLGKVHAPDLDRPALMEELIALLCTPTDATVATAAQEERAWQTKASTISS
ncbi:TetR/AcrR family transcriptional regulator [Sphingomonas sp. S6]|jgi:AcrR family transcriptional regulator|uniref:TetR/AcrR family transcriptional regulator n=1 Tax=Sphingomonas sp. S6 TaxID=3368600 RepID=UPI000FAF321E|nr:TetR/AcrR family transcriptional regulator [uncultured Sphingomonas sp.]RTL22631.1 MAG: TetR/AcrR family transcriptional regulator [Sphingomonadaceae bacterium]